MLLFYCVIQSVCCLVWYSVYTSESMSFNQCVALCCTLCTLQSPSYRNKLIGVDDIALANVAEVYQGKHLAHSDILSSNLVLVCYMHLMYT